MTREADLALCDSLLTQAESLERDLKKLASQMPPGVTNTARYIHKTAECAHVVVARLHSSYNAIRRFDHD